MDAAVSSLGTVSRAIMNNLVNGPGQTPMRAPQLTRPRADTLRIAVPSILAGTLIAPALPRFMQQHLEIGVRLFTGLQPSAPFVAGGRGIPLPVHCRHHADIASAASRDASRDRLRVS